MTGIKVLPRGGRIEQYRQNLTEYSSDNSTWTSLPIPGRCFYKGWRLNEVFDYTLANNGSYRRSFT